MRLDGNSLTLDAAAEVIFNGEEVSLSAAARDRVKQARDVVDGSLTRGEPIYGINTGFGKLAETRIPPDKLLLLQKNLVLSHACGTGPALPAHEVRSLLLAKANTLAKGHSGVRAETLDHLLAMLNRDVLPVVPEQGSVGASGDLAPLAHVAAVAIGEGQADCKGERLAGTDALKKAGLGPIRLAAKEGLALLNGTHFMTGVGAVNCLAARRLLVSADIIGALSAEALLCTPTAFDARIHASRGYAGQMECATRLRRMMAHSEIRESHRYCGRVQDPYSVRCIPQVHGAIADNLTHVEHTITTELNAATDNPLIFTDGGDGVILSGGNFHGHPISTAMDLLSIVFTQLGVISERRIALMLDVNMSELPAFLVRDSGLNSGFMISQVAAAGLASENKVLSHPASVDSIPTSANQEDYVSMGAGAAVKARKIVDNTRRVLAIELLAACQALELRAPLRPGPAGQGVLALVRQHVPFLDSDRIFSNEIEKTAELIGSGAIVSSAAKHLGTLD